MDITYPCGKEVVEAVLPHRDPFVWVSRVTACVPGESIVAELDVEPDLPLFKGHFPGHPVLPGVIIMEALAQAASFCILVAQQREGAIGFLTGISKRMCVAEVCAFVGGNVAASATQKYVLA